MVLYSSRCVEPSQQNMYKVKIIKCTRLYKIIQTGVFLSNNSPLIDRTKISIHVRTNVFSFEKMSILRGGGGITKLI